jgi:hypothetical protein
MTSQALKSLRILLLLAPVMSAMSLFGALMFKSVTPLLCWGSDLLVSVRATVGLGVGDLSERVGLSEITLTPEG